MPKHRERKTVPYNKDQMFNLVSDIDSYKEFLPWCNDSKIISREGHHDRDVIIADLIFVIWYSFSFLMLRHYCYSQFFLIFQSLCLREKKNE